MLQGPCGVFLFVYSCILSRGVEALREDLGMDPEPLVSMPHGHANQSLINLLLTGQATGYVHDGVQDVGIKLVGVTERPAIGYLTLLESMRYVQVGSFYKSPRYPIWVVGSETHMTVVFSSDDRLVS